MSERRGQQKQSRQPSAQFPAHFAVDERPIWERKKCEEEGEVLS